MKYFKQYGEQRTGTNYLKSLLELNFKKTIVFASVLGWKHGMYETSNYKERWYMSGNKVLPEFECESHEQWIKKMTKGGSVYCVDNYKLPFSIKELEHACDHLNYIFMIKDIYGFIYSFKKFRHPKMTWQEITDRGWIEQWCDRYEMNYRNWIEVYEKNKTNSIFVRYEDLIVNKNKILNQFKFKFNLTNEHEGYVDEQRVVKASTDMGLIKTQEGFNKKFYIDRLYMDELPNSVKIIIDHKYNNVNFQVLETKVSNRLNLS